jgi:hypothetical protein
MTIHQAAIRCSIGPFLMGALLAVASVSSADPVTVRFTVFPDPADPVNLVPLSSSFTFDSSLIPPAAGFVEDRTGQLATEIGPFTWGNTVWTTANASVWFLRFDALHGLRDFALGGAPGGFDGSMFGVDDVAIRVPFSSYTLGAVPAERFFNGRTVSPDVVTPEPGTFLLLASGIAALAARRRSLRSFGKSTRTQANEG